MAWYRSGTIAVTSGSKNVTGTGTTWLDNAAAGEALLGPDGKLYEIDAITSNTALVLKVNYAGANASGQAYAIVPTQSFIRDLASQAAALVNTYSGIANNAGAGKFADGTVGGPGISFTNDQDTGFFRSGSNEVTFVANGVAQFKFGTSGLVFITGNAALNALNGVTPAADKIPYFTSGTAAATATISAYGRSLIDDADAAAARTTLGLGTAATANTGTGAANVVLGNDSRLSDSREWTAAEVPKAEAEARTATTPRKWTALRVGEAIAAWWNAVRTALPAPVNVAGELSESGSAVVVAADVGTEPNQIPLNAHLGALAYRDNTLVPVPSAANAPGLIGDMAIDSSYVYFCVATNTWKRAALSTW